MRGVWARGSWKSSISRERRRRFESHRPKDLGLYECDSGRDSLGLLVVCVFIFTAYDWSFSNVRLPTSCCSPVVTDYRPEGAPIRTISATLSGVVIAVSLPLALAAPVPVQTFATAAGVVKITSVYHVTAMIQAGGDILY